MNSPDPNDRLSRALTAWRVAPASNPNFRPEVWQRIRATTRETWATYVRTHLVGWSVAAGLAVVAAGWTGHSLARAKLETGRERMIVAYLGELDPRVLAKMRP